VTDVRRAAGGLLWRVTDGTARLAVIHRPRYDDWCLPKGKLRRDEPAWDGARREVAEETGCTPRLGGYAGTVTYPIADARLKVVSFWHMTVQHEAPFAPNDEVDELLWLTPADAAGRLSYPHERALLARAAKENPMAAQGLFRRFVIGSFGRPAQEGRLRDALGVARIDLERRIALEPDEPWAGAAQRFLAEAEAALEAGHVGLGFQALLAARRMEVYGLNDNERADRAAALIAEAGHKLSGWRRAAVQRLLRVPRPPAPRLAYAYELRDDSAQNEYHIIALLREQFAWLAVVVGACIGATVLAVARNGLPLDDLSEYASWDVIRFVMLFGMLGGSLSGMYSLMRAPLKGRIPSRVGAAVITLARPLAGAAAALISYVLLRAEWLSALLSPELATNGAGVLSVAFLAGMSERFILRVVTDRTRGQAEPAESAPAAPAAAGGGAASP
jgi:8-oxo-dGTP diphosphatase